MERYRAEVTIAGNNYILSGDKDEEKIREIAKFVDDEMDRIGEAAFGAAEYRRAVLAAVNIAEKLLDNVEMLSKLQAETHQLDNDVKHYISLWENAKKQVTELKEKMAMGLDKQADEGEKYRELERKCNDMENAYFDLQMENVNLKNELRSLKKFNKEDE